MEAIKRLPVGISDFKTLQRSHKYFVDKTKYLPLLEEISNFLFLIRPRRFGKISWSDLVMLTEDRKPSFRIQRKIPDFAI